VIKLHLINPLLNRRLKHKNYAITGYLEASNIQYQIVDKDPDWIVIHPLFGNYLMNDKSVLDNLSDDNIQRLKQGRSYLLIWYPYETEHYGHPNVRRQIESCLEHAGIENKCCFLVTGNLNAKYKSFPYKNAEKMQSKQNNLFYDYVIKVYPGWIDPDASLEQKQNKPLPDNFDLHKIQNILTRDPLQDSYEQVQSVPLLFFDWQLNNFLNERNEMNQLQRTITYKNNKSKAYMCLNGKDKHTRRYLLDRLPIDKGHVSYVCYDGKDPYVQSKTDVPIILDQERQDIRRNDRWMNPEIYHDAYINVVTEAFPDKEIDCFITEKTFKPMLQLQPFMIQGNRYTLKRLREAGYETFPELWDESYDELETWQERTDAMVEELHSFCTLSTHDQLAKCKRVMSKLLHNQEMVFKTSRELTRSAHLADILRAFSSGG
tara:strand:+ start:375 stop:1670 length:1296 start_codon:yes stop_codon:yes gene_type:complete